MKVLLINLVGLLIFSAHTAEIDHFLFAGEEIRDEAETINQQLNKNMREVIKKYNDRGATISCSKLTKKIGSYFGGGFTSKLGKWVKKNKDIDQRPNDIGQREYYKISIHQDDRFPVNLPHLANVINIGGIYTGTDKLGHMLRIGKKYYGIYVKGLRKNQTEEEIMKKIYEYGNWTERFIWGIMGPRVYSYADLEADFQGFLLYKSFCHGDNPKLVKENGLWALKAPVDLREYVNPNMNEIWNPSAFKESKAKNMRVRISNSCKYLRKSKFYKRWHFYKRFGKESTSFKYINAIRDQGKIPDNRPFMVKNICPEEWSYLEDPKTTW